MTVRAALLPCIAAVVDALSLTQTPSHTDDLLKLEAARDGPVSSGPKVAWNDGMTDSAESFRQLGWPYVDWGMCKVALHSNLAGLGPDAGEESVRYYNVWTSSEGRGIDMVVTANSSYSAYTIGFNGLVKQTGCFGQINVLSSTPVELLFSFYLTGTNSSVSFEKFYFSLFDLDRSNTAVESATFFRPAKLVTLNQETDVLQSGNFDSGLTLTATGYGDGSDNPRSPEQLDDQHRKRAAMVKYENTAQFKVIFAVEGGAGGRNFVFAGHSNVEDTPAPTPPTPPPTLSPAAVPTPAPTDVPGVTYTIYFGKQCLGSEADISENFFGTAEECMERCSKMNRCSGFVRVKSGNAYGLNGKCIFRAGSISSPYTYTSDNRDCYIYREDC